MTEDTKNVAPSEQSEAELKHEFEQIYLATKRHDMLRKKEKETGLTEDEKAFILSMPPLYRRGMEITRILRRTNTGPAKVKTTAKRSSKKAVLENAVSKLLEDF